jgi:hypothetical protein
MVLQPPAIIQQTHQLTWPEYTVNRNFNQSELSESASRCAMCRLTYELTRRYRGDSFYPDEAQYTFEIDRLTGALREILVLLASNRQAPQTFILEVSPYSGKSPVL